MIPARSYFFQELAGSEKADKCKACKWIVFCSSILDIWKVLIFYKTESSGYTTSHSLNNFTVDRYGLILFWVSFRLDADVSIN